MKVNKLTKLTYHITSLVTCKEKRSDFLEVINMKDKFNRAFSAIRKSLEDMELINKIINTNKVQPNSDINKLCKAAKNLKILKGLSIVSDIKGESDVKDAYNGNN